MKEHSQRRYTAGEYFAIEESSEIKHEYYDGTIFATAGASVNHNRIVRNLLAAFHTALRGSECEAFGSDLRVFTPAGLYTYPDVMVVCGPLELVEAPLHTIANPCLIVEVLSESTAEYDKGEKFTLYQSIPALRDYILISQGRPLAEHFEKTNQGTWSSRPYSALTDRVVPASIPTILSLEQIYEHTTGTY